MSLQICLPKLYKSEMSCVISFLTLQMGTSIIISSVLLVMPKTWNSFFNNQLNLDSKINAVSQQFYFDQKDLARIGSKFSEQSSSIYFWSSDFTARGYVILSKSYLKKLHFQPYTCYLEGSE